MSAVEGEPGEPLRCPTCRAAWRAVSACPRCGTDLAPLMTVAARAWHLREAAREALGAGRDLDARALARAAIRLHATPRGRRLLVLTLLATGEMTDAGAANTLMSGPAAGVKAAAFTALAAGQPR